MTISRRWKIFSQPRKNRWPAEHGWLPSRPCFFGLQALENDERATVEAVRIYEENKDRIDLVVLDMSGSEIFARMKEINPDAKVLLSSGYSINGQATRVFE